MVTKPDGKRALADLAAGKFSFEMVDAIKDYAGALETDLERVEMELERVSALHERALNHARQQEYKIFRLEGELRALNARVYALLKTNALTETALNAAKRGAVSVVEFLPVARDYAEAGSKKALAYLATIDFKGKFEALKAHPMTQKAQREIERLAVKLVEYLPVARRQAEEASKKAWAYLSTVGLPAAKTQLAAVVEKASVYIADLQKKVASL
ncbi:MAG: hypothetical protein AB7U61_02945 [Methylocystis sp.]